MEGVPSEFQLGYRQALQLCCPTDVRGKIGSFREDEV